MVMLPPLSQRLRGILRMMAAKESSMTTKLGAPDLLKGTGDLVEDTLIRIMQEIEKGPGSTRLW